MFKSMTNIARIAVTNANFRWKNRSLPLSCRPDTASQCHRQLILARLKICVAHALTLALYTDLRVVAAIDRLRSRRNDEPVLVLHHFIAAHGYIPGRTQGFRRQIE